MKNKMIQTKRTSFQAPIFTSRLTKALAVGVIASALATSVSQAVLRVTFDMRAVQTGIGNPPGTPAPQSNGLVSVDPATKSAQIASGASSIVLQLVATINGGAVTTDDFFLRGDGSFVTSGTVGLTGSMRSDALTVAGINNVEPFRGIAAKSGKGTADLTTVPDNILDIGSNASTSAFTDFFTAQSSDLTNGASGQVFVLGETVLNLNGTLGTTTVNFVPRLFTGAGAAGARTSFIFKIDTVQFAYRGDGALATQVGGVGDPTTFVFNPITLTVVPEPSAFGMVLLGAMSVVGFRRLGIRRS